MIDDRCWEGEKPGKTQRRRAVAAAETNGVRKKGRRVCSVLFQPFWIYKAFLFSFFK